MLWHKINPTQIDPSNLITGDVYRGYNDDATPYAEYWLWYEDGMYRIHTTLGRKLMVDGVNYPSVFRNYNSQRYFKLGANYIWYSSTLSLWVLSGCLGMKTYEAWVPDEPEEAPDGPGAYAGDAWWSCSSLTGQYLARGASRGTVEGEYNGTAKTVDWLAFEGWTSATLAGIYTKSETASKRFGAQRLICSASGTFLENLQEYNNYRIALAENSTPGSVAWYNVASGKWTVSDAMGLASSTVGYWEQVSAPANPADGPAGAYQLVYDGPSGSTPTPVNFSLTHSEYVNTASVSPALSLYTAQASIWLAST